MTINLPMDILHQIDGGNVEIEIKLNNGRTVKRCWVTDKGLIEGVIVGGQDGIDPLKIDFSIFDIKAIRKTGTFKSLAGMGWVQLT